MCSSNTTGTVLLCVVMNLVFLLRRHECAISDTCTDMMSLGSSSTVHHSMAKTAAGDIKTGLVLRETVLPSDTHVYYVYIRPICKVGDEYKYNCLALKTFTSYEQLKSMNNKVCWNHEKYIGASCRLPTIRIISGFIFCELEIDSTSQKPRLAKIDLKTGQLLKTRTLSDAKETTNCLKTRQNYWKPDCSGKVEDFMVHMLVDEAGLRVMYQSSSNNEYFIEKINTADLKGVSPATKIDDIGVNSRVLLICGKLYIIPVHTGDKALTITKSIDLFNTKNSMVHKVKLLDHFQDGINSWIHYNPNLSQLFVGWPNKDSLIFKVLKCDYAFPDTTNMDLSQIKNTFLWSLVPSENEQKTDMVNTLTSFFKITDAMSLKSISSIIMKCPPKVCNDINNPHHQYCRIKSVVTSVKLYSDYKQDKKLSIRRLQAQFHMGKLLEQQNFETMSNRLNELRSFVGKNFLEVKKQLNSVRKDFGGYFNSLANFDQKKSRSDFQRIKGILDGFKSRVDAIGSTIAKKINVLFIGATSSVSADIAAKIAKFAISTLAFANPIEAISKTTGSILAAINLREQLAIAGVELVKVLKLKSFFPKIKQMGILLKNVTDKNSRKFKTLQKLVRLGLNGKLDERKLAENADNFLVEYDTYRPNYSTINITDYESWLSSVIDGLCNAIYKGSTIPSSVVQAVFSGRADCLKTKVDVKSMMALYRGMRGLHDGLIAAYASAARATVAKSNAKRIMKIDHEISVEKFAMTQVNLIIYTLEIFVNSALHRIMLIHEACTLIEYKNGGVMPDYCLSAIRNPQGASFSSLVASKFDKDMCSSDTNTRLVNIPAMEQSSKTDIPPGTIDLTALYKGKDVPFRVPNKDWLIQNDWIDRENKDNMIILKSLELFLPMLQDPKKRNTVSVRTSLKLEGDNRIKPGGTEYDFNNPLAYRYNFRYDQYQQACNFQWGGAVPYSVLGCENPPKICRVSQGTVKESLYPSVFAKWKIDASINRGELSRPHPKGKFLLQAYATICIIRPVKINGVRQSDEMSVNSVRDLNFRSIKRESCCVDRGMYFDPASSGDKCKTCPDASRPYLFGYYCEMK